MQWSRIWFIQCNQTRILNAYLGDQNTVTRVDTHRNALAVTVNSTRSNSENLSLVLLLDGALGKEDTGGGFGLGLNALDEDAVQEGSKVLDVAEERLKGAIHVSNFVFDSSRCQTGSGS